MRENTVTFGEYLKHKREERQISLRELARRLNVSAPFISDDEKKSPYSLDGESPADLG
jgi:transcriptional regulator with XRE-family HTH domain